MSWRRLDLRADDVAVTAERFTPSFIASVGIAGALVALVACLYFTQAVLRESLGINGEIGEERERGIEMERIRKMIYDGARTYLNTQCEFGEAGEYLPFRPPAVASAADKWLSIWVAVLFVLITILLGVTAEESFSDGPLTAFAFVVGSLLSAAAGYAGMGCDTGRPSSRGAPPYLLAPPPAGMLIATQANSRTAQACKTSISRGLEVSFASVSVAEGLPTASRALFHIHRHRPFQGAVMGNAVVGLGLFGLCLFYLGFSYSTEDSGAAVIVSRELEAQCQTLSWTNFNRVFNRMAGFGFGASTIGMFARVGGGVFTKVRARTASSVRCCAASARHTCICSAHAACTGR